MSSCNKLGLRLAVPSGLLASIVLVGSTAWAAPPYQANGVKVGEVTHTSAIIWTRLTRNPKRLDDGAPWRAPKRVAKEGEPQNRGRIVPGSQLPEGLTVDDVEGAVPGAPGEVRVVYVEKGSGEGERATPWTPVDPERDFTRQFTLEGLQPSAQHAFRVECRGDAAAPAGPTIEGSFRTAPAPDDPARVVFTVVTGQAYRDQDFSGGHKAYLAMLELAPSFFVHTGDIVYYDGGGPVAQNVAQARHHWHRMYSLPAQVEFHRRVASYFIKDDHDAWQNDCWPTMSNNKMGDFTFAEGLAVFPEQVPMGDSTYRTVRWGKDLQIWMVEGRDFRSSNRMPDGPQKTIWGEKQKAWFKQTVAQSDATFRVLVSPTPLVGPDRQNKADNHSNRAFTHEGNELRRFIAGQENMVVACGDRHWQYVSVHPETSVREYSSGPISDAHAGGWKQSDFVESHHRYLNVTGGFLSATVERAGGRPTLTFRHHAVDGKVLHEDRLTAE
jgi:alkaline phosphatase D